MNDVIGLLTYPLSQGNRWLPEGAKDLLEKELDERNQQGQKLLKEALGGNDIKEFVGKRTEGIRKDLDAMYRQLGQGDAVPNERLSTVLDDVKNRLTDALSQRTAPRAAYNRVGAPDLTATAPDDNWNQPFLWRPDIIVVFDRLVALLHRVLIADRPNRRRM